MDASPPEATTAVLAVLAGTSLHDAAARAGMTPADLTEAVETYKAAGDAALETQARTHGWFQAHVQFPDWAGAEHTAATHLWPKLHQAETAGIIRSWWYIRKAPCWRLRCHPGTTTAPTETQEYLRRMLDALACQHHITAWHETIYEPETLVFGGTGGMDIAHRLFHADSHAILDHLARPSAAGQETSVPGRRELSVLLCSTFMRAAGQDWFERADIWRRVQQLRPISPGTPHDRLQVMGASMGRLMTADTTALTTDGQPLAFAADWATSFANAGAALATAAHTGTLTRGLRAILAHHIIFHWNRFGLSARAQGILAAAATETITE